MKLVANLMVWGLQVTLLRVAVTHMDHAPIHESLAGLATPLYLCYLAFHLLPALGVSLAGEEANVRLRWLTIWVKVAIYSIIMYSAWPVPVQGGELALIEAFFYCFAMELIDQHLELTGKYNVPQYASLNEFFEELKRLWRTITGKE